MERINVTRTFLPPLEEYQEYLNKIWSNGQLTNQGPLLLNFESKIKKYLGVENFHFVTNGTLALQIVIKALEIENSEIITTPFSYVASTSAILWERNTPVFVDIDPETFCIDYKKIEKAITPRTKAILAVHVFGNPCQVEEIEAIASKNKLKVIYDAAHAFSVKYKNKSLLDYGDASICSFHSTKLFHTIEGGGIVTSDKIYNDRIELIKRFGHQLDDHIMLGINAKASEFQAAMGLCNLKHIKDIVNNRSGISQKYDKELEGRFQTQKISPRTEYNYAYYPILFDEESELIRAMSRLAEVNIYPRRYFYPSLNRLSYLDKQYRCPISEDISSRILCLPLYYGLQKETVEKICRILKI